MESETPTGGSSLNEIMGRVYERETALQLHHRTAASRNTDPEYNKKIQAMIQKHEEDKKLLPPQVLDTAIKRAHKSADAYLESLQNNHGIFDHEIHEIHHTSKGIDNLVGEKTDRTQNPHDVVIKTKKGKLHGASLKATSGTLSNNGLGPFTSHAEMTGIGGNTHKIWKSSIANAGLEGKSIKEIKAMRNDPTIKSQYKQTQLDSAGHHTLTFNNASHENKIKHMEMLMKLGYNKNIPYDYVNGAKGTSEPIEQKKHVELLRKAKSLHAVQKGNRVFIHDHEGTPILDIEHRSTHGAFVGNQINAKLASIPKVSKTSLVRN